MFTEKCAKRCSYVERRCQSYLVRLLPLQRLHKIRNSMRVIASRDWLYVLLRKPHAPDIQAQYALYAPMRSRGKIESVCLFAPLCPNLSSARPYCCSFPLPQLASPPQRISHLRVHTTIQYNIPYSLPYESVRAPDRQPFFSST